MILDQFSQAKDSRQCAAKPATLAGSYLCRRHSIHPSIADLVASLAGLGNRRNA
jgi:hypothetical protein